MRVCGAVSWVFGGAALLVVSCTNDYDEFSFTGQSGAAGAAATGGSGGAAGTTGGAAGTTGGAAGSTGGSGGAAGSGGAGATGGSAGSGATGGSAGSGGVGATGGSAGSGATGGSAGSGATGGSAGSGGSSTGFVSCEGTNDCDLSTSFCCISQQNGTSCVANGTPCPQATDVFCDGPEDCNGGNVCCGQLGGGGSYYSELDCMPGNQCQFNFSRVVICGGSPNSCPGGAQCQPSQILPQYNVCSPN